VKVLLVKPKARIGAVLGLQSFQLLEPLELGYLAGALPAHHDVRILDLRLARFENLAFIRTLAHFRPEIVGFTGYTHEGSIIKELAVRTHRSLPQAKIIVGGHHATVAPEDFETDQIHAIVRGEGCQPFRSIVDRLEKKAELDGLANVIVPGTKMPAADPGSWPEFPDPATLPTPRRDLWNPNRYRAVWTAEHLKKWEPVFPPVSMVRTSWGCKMKCSFCIVPFLCAGKHQPRPVESVVDEIASTPSSHIYFSDDENFIDEEFAWQLAGALEERQVKKRYFAWTRSTTVNRSPELLKMWRGIGLDSAFLGFEFPTNEELKRAQKGGTVSGNEQALDSLRRMGIAVHAAFMVRPEYTEDDFSTLRMYVQSLPPVQCSFTVCTPSPGTPDYEEMQPNIWIDNAHDLHDCMHPLTPTKLPLRRFAQLFADQAAAGTSKTPLRVNHHVAPPLDLLRVVRAEARYYRGFKNMYRDYPRELWD
jgi:radical SAM superfamily enzyme YgiQ (UPF0313 family)